MYPTTFEGQVRTLNGKYPMLWTTREGAEREAAKFNGVNVITVRDGDYDLRMCSIDRHWPADLRG